MSDKKRVILHVQLDREEMIDTQVDVTNLYEESKEETINDFTESHKETLSNMALEAIGFVGWNVREEETP